MNKFKNSNKYQIRLNEYSNYIIRLKETSINNNYCTSFNNYLTIIKYLNYFINNKDITNLIKSQQETIINKNFNSLKFKNNNLKINDILFN